MKRLFLGFLSFLLLTFAACGSKETALPPYGQGNKEEFEQFLTEIEPQEDPWTEEELQTYDSYLQPETFEHTFSEEEMQELLMDSRRKIRFHERFLKIGRILETIVMVVIIAVVAVIIIV